MGLWTPSPFWHCGRQVSGCPLLPTAGMNFIFEEIAAFDPSALELTLHPSYQLLDRPTSEFLRPLLISLPPASILSMGWGEMAQWVKWGLLHKPEDLELRSSALT